MEIILLAVVGFYAMYLNLRIKEIQEELTGVILDTDTLEIKIYNKMMDIRKEIKQSIKTKKIEKSRRRSTKGSRKVSPTKIS